MATASYFRPIYTGSVVKRILPASPVDTLYEISSISCSTALPLSLYVNLSSALHFLCFIFGRDFLSLVGCGPTVESLRSFSTPPSLGKDKMAPPPGRASEEPGGVDCREASGK